MQGHSRINQLTDCRVFQFHTGLGQWCISMSQVVQWNLATYSATYSGQHRDPADCCIQWVLSTVDTIGTQLTVLYTVGPLYSGHHRDPADCAVYSGSSL